MTCKGPIETFVAEIAEENLEKKSTERLLNIYRILRRAHPYWNTSWFCDGCPGPSSEKNYCRIEAIKEDKSLAMETLCKDAAYQRDRVKEILDDRPHVERKKK